MSHVYEQATGGVLHEKIANMEHVDRNVVEPSPELEFAEDYGFLDDIIDNYTPKSIPRISLSKFKAQYLDMLARDQTPQEFQRAQYIWIQDVAKNPRTPVIVHPDNEPEVVQYVVPPICGTIKTGRTGHEGSMASRYQYLAMQYSRLISQGRAVEKVLFDNIEVDDLSNKQYQNLWYCVLRDFGYLKSNEVKPSDKAEEETVKLFDYVEEDDDFEY